MKLFQDKDRYGRSGGRPGWDLPGLPGRRWLVFDDVGGVNSVCSVITCYW